MALNTSKCNHLTSLRFKRLNHILFLMTRRSSRIRIISTTAWLQAQTVLPRVQQAFIDIRLRPGRARNWRLVADLADHATPYRPLRPNVASSIKPEIHNIAQRRQRRTEPRPQEICTQNFGPIGLAVPKICSRTDRHTDRRTDNNTPHPYRGGAIIRISRAHYTTQTHKGSNKDYTVHYISDSYSVFCLIPGLWPASNRRKQSRHPEANNRFSLHQHTLSTLRDAIKTMSTKTKTKTKTTYLKTK